MISNYNIQKKSMLVMAPFLLLLLASCGSYQESGYERDGIYGDVGQRAPAEKDQTQYATEDDNAGSYYKNLFAEKSNLYGEMAESMVFTDVEDYSSAEGYENETYEDDRLGYTGGNAPWGEEPDEYTINIYNNGFYGGFYNPWRWGWGNSYFHRWHDPFFFDPFWGPGYFGPGFHPYWGSGFGYGFGSPYWGNRFGFGFGFGGMYGFGTWGWGWNSPFYGHYNRFDTRDYAYNAGRRNAYSDYTTSVRRDATSDSRRSSSYSRSIREIRGRENATSTRRQAVRRGDDNSRIYSRSTRSSEPTRINRNTNRRSEPTYNRTRTTRSNNTYNRSSSPVRSSGTMRSSGGSTRSSGTVRSSGGSSRGGGRR